ncbi:MAG: phenylacetate--CoA ligase [Abditibacteriota bacterium]|nr:phenylacetate--CoA ligase [Abditibacteriota bacterium]
MYWDKQHECMDREALTKLQSERLCATVKRAYENVPAYTKKFDEIGLKPEDIKGIEDLHKIPFTVKTDFRDNYPFGLFATDMDDVVRVHASSGTTGKATVVGYTKNDIDCWATMVARQLAAGGVGSKDIVQVAYGYGLFTGGLGLHYGAEKVGATVIPISTGNTKRQITMLQDMGATAIAGTPSYILHIGETVKEMGIDPKTLPVKVAIMGAEPWTEEMRKEIEELLDIDALDIYGLSEVMGPGVSYECLEKHGLHINEDMLIAEIIDPDTGEQLPDGKQGELVFTSLTKEALPLLRYRTKDITYLDPEPCACGRTFKRMHRILGRCDDMLIIRGVNVFPSQIETVIFNIEGIEPHYQIVVDRDERRLDDMEVWVEVSPDVISGEVRTLEKLNKKITHDLRSLLGIGCKVKLVEPLSIPRSEGKSKRIIDKREVYK